MITRFSRGMSTPAIRAMLRLPLPLLVLEDDADDHHHAGALDDLASLAARLHGRRNLHLILYVMRPRVRSYGLSSTRTVSPGRMRMKFWRSFPEMWASTSCPFSRRTLNIAFGRGRITSPSTSMASFFAKRHAPSVQALDRSMGTGHAERPPLRATRERGVYNNPRSPYRPRHARSVSSLGPF